MFPIYTESIGFRPITESRFRKPCGTESCKTLYLLLRSFTQRSVSPWNQLSLVFKVLVGSLGYRFPSSIVPILGTLLSLPTVRRMGYLGEF